MLGCSVSINSIAFQLKPGSQCDIICEASYCFWRWKKFKLFGVDPYLGSVAIDYYENSRQVFYLISAVHTYRFVFSVVLH